MRRFVKTLALALGSLMLSLVPAASAVGQTADGAVYTLSNDPAGNAVVVFDRAADGTLSPGASVPTGGLGSGDGLGSQGALILSDDGAWLIAVNAGSNEVSVLSVGASGVVATDVAPSGGTRPISVTMHGSLVYVLNDGSDTVSGLRLEAGGTLTPIPDSTAGLSGTDIAPAQVEFTPDGSKLVVTEKNTNLIDVFKVRGSGRLTAPKVRDSEGQTPFGFAFDPSGRLIVSEAFGGAPGASTLSSYAVERNGVLTTISASVPDGQAAACWVVATSDGRFAYTSNTGSDTVSGYTIGADGSVSLFAGDPFPSGDAPTDMALAGGSFLYALNSGSDDLSAYTVGADGTLAPIGGASGLPAAAVGLAAA
jgi:6-phosphogluconolactonase (cycloisomerase 2 family)